MGNEQGKPTKPMKPKKPKKKPNPNDKNQENSSKNDGGSNNNNNGNYSHSSNTISSQNTNKNHSQSGSNMSTNSSKSNTNNNQSSISSQNNSNHNNSSNINNNNNNNNNKNKNNSNNANSLGTLDENAESNDMGFKMNKKMTINDFTFLKVVGKGSFGKVMQVRKNDNGQIYALKVLKKKELVKRKQVVHTQTERRVLSNIDNPFIVSLRYSFQSDAKLYMVLDFFNGGELFFHLKNEGRFSQKRSKFYSGEICLALECLHSNGIIYRDLKPENVLLDSDGHIKITDFGLSKDSLKGDMITHTFCGTPEYLAPEVLHQQGHGKAVDWWSFGTLLYEMMTGLPPFYNENLNIMYEKILHAPIPLPKYLTKEARSIFLGLLERDPKRRLGSSDKDAQEIKDHPFYKDLDFKKLYSKELKPPFKPKVKNIHDTSNVDEEFTEEVPKDTLVDKTGSMLAAKDMFNGFTYDGNKDNNILIKK